MIHRVRYASLVVSAAALAFVAGAASSVQAQTEPAKPAAAAAPAAAQPAKAEKTGLSPEVKQLLEKSKAAYKALKSYEDKAELKFEMRAKSKDGQDHNSDDSETLNFSFGGAGKYTLAHRDFALYSDGTTFTAHAKPLNEYLQRPVASDLNMEEVLGPMISIFAVHAPWSLITGQGMDAKAVYPILTDATTITAETRNGQAGKRISGRGSLAGMPEEQSLPVTVWISDETSLIGELSFDLKPMYTEMMNDEGTVDKAMGTISFTDLKINSEVPADKLVFKPGAEDKKVDKLGGDMESGPDPQQELVGAPAPDFKGVSLDGKPMGLADFKGKIVVMDFWATWCGPCMQAIPKVQQLWEEYGSKGVVVLGINQDTPDVKEKVASTVEKKKLTFAQYMDSDNSVGQKYQVSGIPCTIIVDGKGVIQYIHTGNTPTFKKELAEALDKLLKGETLVKPKEAKKDEPKK